MLPIGWKNSLLVFSTITETAVDIENTSLTINKSIPPYLLESHAAIHNEDLASIPTEHTTTEIFYSSAPTLCDPYLSTSTHSKSHFNVFVENLLPSTKVTSVNSN